MASEGPRAPGLPASQATQDHVSGRGERTASPSPPPASAAREAPGGPAAGSGRRTLLRTCRVCRDSFDPSLNSNSACRSHPESFAGETAQRWLAPGEGRDTGGDVHFFWTCCGAGRRDALGCCAGRHVTYEEAESIAQRMPGAGVGDAARPPSPE